MKSNSFGSWQQTIIILIARKNAEEAAARLSLPAPTAGNNLDKVRLEWQRWTNRRGDDEDVVFTLFQILGENAEELDWKIDWEASIY